MAEFPSMPLYTDAYIGDTMHLSLEEHGAYLKLLMIAWRTPDCCIPDDDKRIAQMLSVTPKKWVKLKPVVMSFWTLSDGVYRQKKLTKLRQAVNDSRKKYADAGRRGGLAKSLKCNGSKVSDATNDASSQASSDGVTYHLHNHNHTSQESKTPSRERPSRQGSRLPENWWPDDEQWQIGMEHLGNEQRVKAEAEKFRDYWIAKPGKDGRKANWTATWRNWLRRSKEYQPAPDKWLYDDNGKPHFGRRIINGRKEKLIGGDWQEVDPDPRMIGGGLG